MNDFRKGRPRTGYGSEDMAERAERESLIKCFNEEEARIRMQDLLYGDRPHRRSTKQQ